jgi:WD40 repeat protein
MRINRRGFLALLPATALAAAPKAAPIYSLAWHPDGQRLAIGGFREVRLVKVPEEPVTTFSGAIDAVRAVSFSPDGSLLAAAGGQPGRRGEVKVWEVASGKLTGTMVGHKDAIYAAAFSPDGKTLATSSYDKMIELWDVANAKPLRTLKDHIDAVYALAYTPDGKLLVSAAADRTVKIWNPDTGERLYTLSDATDGLNTLALDPTGKYVAAGGLDKTIRVWSLGEKAGELQKTLIAHEDSILQLTWSKEGTIASSSADRTIRFFHAGTLDEAANVQKTADWAMALRYSPNGELLAAGHYNGSLKIMGDV